MRRKKLARGWARPHQIMRNGFANCGDHLEVLRTGDATSLFIQNVRGQTQRDKFNMRRGPWKEAGGPVTTLVC